MKTILKTLFLFSIINLLTSVFVSCEEDDDTVTETEVTSTTDDDDLEDTDEAVEIGDDHEQDDDYIWDSSSVVQIVLNGSSITVTGEGATVEDTVVTINTGGNYEITGTLTDGQIVVNTDDDATVRLIFNGINVTNSTSAPVNITSSEKTIIILSDDTVNYLTDTSNYIFEDDEDEPNATLYSADDLTIYGNGTLIVDANYNDGITSKDGLIIKSGTIEVTAVDDAIRGKDYIVVKDGNITVNADGDGLTSDNDNGISGFIVIDDGTFNITAEGDGISAENSIEIYYGEFNIETGGGNSSYLSDSSSAKGIKSGVDITIEGGEFNIDSADDNIHASSNITITTGTFELASGDDAIHSDDTIEINNGEITITNTVEGIEAPNITINNGVIYINSSDDAINAAGNTTNYLYINGGYIVINASGDGIDSNGNIEMNDGTVIVNGPTASNNSPIDYDGKFDLNGGFLVASGYASSMDEAGSSSSDQYSLILFLNSTQTASTLVHIQDSDGDNVLTFAPSKKYKSIVFSSSDLSNGSTYSVYLGGSSTGTKTDGVYEGGTYSGGSLETSFTISSKVTTIK